MISLSKLLTSFTAIFLVGVFLNTAHAEVLTNESVMMLTKAGLGAESIVAKIKTSPNTFDMSTMELVKLKQAKVADAVIAAMVQAGSRAERAAVSDSPDPAVMRATGIYVLRDWESPVKMQRMDPTAAAQTKDKGRLLSAVTYGIAKVKIITVVPNPAARVRVSSQPSFYFYFDQVEANLSNATSSGTVANGWLGMGSQPVTSPNEFTMIRFDIKKGNREVVLAQANIAGSQSGVMDTSRVTFSYEDVGDGIFKVTPAQAMQPGEYGFVYSSSGAGNAVGGVVGGGGQSVRIFDFGVE